MRSRSLISVALALAALIVFAAAALAADGDLDQSFNGDGRAVSDPTQVEESVSDLLIDPQGRIVVVGSGGKVGFPSRAYIARFTPDGELDKSFSSDGWEIILWNGEPEAANGVAIDSNGRLVVGGWVTVPGNGPDFAAARFTGEGLPDETFSGDGRATANILQGGTDFGQDVAVDPQNRVLVAGQGGDRMAVARFTEGGVLDTGFGVDEGSQPMGFPAYASVEGKSVEVDRAGRILVGGTARTGVQGDFGVIRLEGADGEFDAAFGFQGRSTLNFGSQSGEQLLDLEVDAAGRYLVAGVSGEAGSNVAEVGRLLENGSPDSSFDGDGKATVALGEETFATKVAADPAGRILVAGRIGNSLGQDGALFRFTPDGALDTSFGNGGVVREDFLASNAILSGIAVDAEGRYVVGGNATAGNASRIGLARFLASYPPSPASGSGPGPGPLTRQVQPRCKGAAATKVGSARRDVLRGTNKRDVIVALGGNDLIKGRGGNDLICAGAGKDVVKAGGGKDRVFGEGGRDRLLGEAGKDVLSGGPGRDVER